MSTYRWKHGWEFMRGHEGEVTITKFVADGDGHDGSVSITATIPADEWVSIITAIGSDKWELAERHKAAHEVHLGHPPLAGPPGPLK